jgi:copper chaperone CopZ
MKKTPFILLLAGAVAIGSGCFIRPRDDLHTHAFKVPAIRSPECSNLILGILGKAAGVKNVEPRPSEGTVNVSFDSHFTALKNIEFALSEAGFDVDDSVGRPAAKARLPEACR